LFQHQERLSCCLDVEASTFKAGTFNGVDQNLYAGQTRGDDVGLHQHLRRQIVTPKLDSSGREIRKKLYEREVSGNAALALIGDSRRGRTCNRAGMTETRDEAWTTLRKERDRLATELAELKAQVARLEASCAADALRALAARLHRHAEALCVPRRLGSVSSTIRTTRPLKDFGEVGRRRELIREGLRCSAEVVTTADAFTAVLSKMGNRLIQSVCSSWIAF
jgi:hypothetical protein